MSKFAVIKTGGKQYLVKEGQTLKVEKIQANKDGLIEFNEVLMTSEGEGSAYKMGSPFLNDFKIQAELVRDGKEKKVLVTRYHSKTRYRKKKGHRQPFSEVRIKEIN